MKGEQTGTFRDIAFAIKTLIQASPRFIFGGIVTMTAYWFFTAYVQEVLFLKKLLEIIRQAEVNCFTNVIMDDMLVIYYSESSDDCYNDMVKTLRRSPFRNYVKREPPKDNEVVYFLLLDKKDKMDKFLHVLKSFHMMNHFKRVS